MPFPFDRYPWVNFHELNLAYFIQHFQEIFSQWDELYNGMLEWKADTEEELETWKNGVMDAIDNWEHDFSAEIQIWQQETEADLANWKTNTLAALDAWKTAAEAVFESIRVQAAGSASAAAQSAADAEAARAAAVTAQAAAEAAAAGVSSSLAQIQSNATSIASLYDQVKKYNSYDIFSEVISGVDRTLNGVTFTWTEKTTCHITGTATGQTFSNILVDTTDHFPEGIEAGKAYEIKASGFIPGVQLRLTLQPSSLPDRTFYFSEDGILTIPEAAAGMTGRIEVSSGTEIPSGGIDVHIALLNTDTNEELSARISDLGEELAELEAAYIPGSIVQRYNSFNDFPVNKYSTISGAIIKILDPNFPYDIDESFSFSVKCFAYGTAYKYIDIIRVDGGGHYTGWTTGSHPTAFYWHDWTEKPEFKVLIFGNSSTYSVWGYTPSLWKEWSNDAKIKIGILYASGASLANHLAMFNEDSAYTEYSLFEGNTWTNTADTITAKSALSSESWDLIVIQQDNDSLMLGTGKEDITDLCNAILNYITYPVDIAFNMPMARGANSTSFPSKYDTYPTGEAKSNAAFNDIADYCDDSTSYAPIMHVIPCGTAIQNARQTSLKSYGANGYLCYDRIGHLQNGIGVLCASYTAAYALMKIAYKSGKIFASVYNPTDAKLAAINLFTSSMHGSCVGISKSNKIIAQKCAAMAIKNPFVISTIE